jgi:DNA-binding response OmpR family regulator
MAKRVLLIDDEEEMVDMVSTSLIAAGYEVVTASESLDGIEKAEAEKPDVILLDIMMPGIDGYEICKSLKKQEETKNIPVIFFTALGDMTLRNKVDAVGGADYIVKPFEPEEMKEKIEKACLPSFGG